MKVTEEQKEILVEFMQTRPELISGKFSSSFTKKDGEALWKEIGETLNSAIGPQKDWKAWRKTWQDLCARTKQKSASNRREANKTGGGVGNIQSLSKTEKFIAAVLTPVAVQGLDIPTPEVTFLNAPSYDHLPNPPSPSYRSVTSVPASPHGSSAPQPSPRRSPRTSLHKTALETPPVNKTIRKRNSAKNAHAEHAKYLKKKLEMREKYYEEKLAIMRSIAESFQTIANAFVLRQL